MMRDRENHSQSGTALERCLLALRDDAGTWDAANVPLATLFSASVAETEVEVVALVHLNDGNTQAR